MHHFSDALRVSLPGGDKVVLSVRVNDNRVDEYRFPLGDFWEMVDAFDRRPSSWEGPEVLQIRVDARVDTVGFAVVVGVDKRDVYRMPRPQFEVMVAQFRSQAGRR